jgi:hypothetical protein
MLEAPSSHPHNTKDGEADKIRCGFGDDRARVDAVDTVKACEHVS